MSQPGERAPESSHSKEETSPKCTTPTVISSAYAYPPPDVPPFLVPAQFQSIQRRCPPARSDMAYQWVEQKV